MFAILCYNELDIVLSTAFTKYYQEFQTHLLTTFINFVSDNVANKFSNE